MNSLIDALDRIGRPRLLVLGDPILDRYTWGNAQRVSPEAPVLVLDADDDEVRLGGAASVALLARGLDADVALAGAIGNDSDGRLLEQLLAQHQIETGLLVNDPTRPTTVKQRFVGRASGRHPHQILRVDRERRDPIELAQQQILLHRIHESLPATDALLISDYGKGVCTPQLLKAVIAAARELKVPVVIDPCRGADYSAYAGASLVTPNRPEAEQAAAQAIGQPQHALAAARRLCRLHSLEAVLVTLDRQGMALCQTGGTEEIIPAKARSVYDVTGAGDMVLAMVGLGLAARIPLSVSVRLANQAAGLEVERFGIMPVARSELREQLQESSLTARKLVSVDQLARLAATCREAGKTIVFTNGCFDLLHVGHVAYLEQASRLGQVLVVAVNSDRSVRRLKGPGRPIIAEADRAALLAALGCVDHVVIFDGDTPHELLRTIRPHVLVKGGTYTVAEVVGREVVEAYGGQIRIAGRVPGVSTTAIVTALQNGSEQPLAKFTKTPTLVAADSYEDPSGCPND